MPFARLKMIGGCRDGEYITADTDREFTEVHRPKKPMSLMVSAAPMTAADATYEIERSYYRPMSIYHGKTVAVAVLVDSHMTDIDAMLKLVAGYNP